jgi:hypothetical protein
MDTANLRLVIALGFLTIAAIVASSAAAWRAPSDAERASNTYPTYLPGQGGCVQDLGYGRVIEGCD